MKPWNGQPESDRRAGLLAGMRIRFKLIVLHTCFSLVLAGVLWLAIRPAIAEVVRQAEAHEAGVILSVVMAERARGESMLESGGGVGGVGGVGGSRAGMMLGPGVTIRTGDAAAVGLDAASAARAMQEGGTVTVVGEQNAPIVAAYDPRVGGAQGYVGVSVVLAGAREAVTRLYTLMILALLLVYALVAAALEVFVLPQHVYGPIRAMLAADRALRDGKKDEELVPPGAIPADELGEIMRSRNQSVLALRRHEADLAAALAKLESVATDLARKNHLLETARRNMAESDRLASLGLMSAGIAHELNTPLAVLKGMVEKVHKSVTRGAAFKAGGGGGGGVGGGAGGGGITPEEGALMLRVVGRLERLSEGLLDFARVRPPQSRQFALRPMVEEAWTLVRLDREAEGVEFSNLVDAECTIFGDSDRLVQVFVNLLRNAVDAMIEGTAQGVRRIEVRSGPGVRVSPQESPGATERSVSVTIADTGPGIDAETMSRLFQPFVSTKLDARGTGLGLAVAEGIVKEHGGVILARNRSEGPGTVFEILLPERAEDAGTADAARSSHTNGVLPVDSARTTSSLSTPSASTPA